jgi:hypothetical protein
MERLGSEVGGKELMTTKDKKLTKFYLAFFSVAILLAGVVSFYASSQPDGLEKVAEEKGFLDTAKDSAVSGSPLSDYGVSGIDSERMSVGLAGVIGVVATAVVAFGLFMMIRRKR